MMEISSKEFGERFRREITDRTMELSEDFLELPLDALTESEILKEVPIVKTFLALFKAGVAYRERAFIKKILKFLVAYNSGNVDHDRLLEFKSAFQLDNKYRDKVLDFLLIEIDRIGTEEKSQVLAKLFVSYLNGFISWEYFVHLSICLEQLHPISYSYLNRLSRKDFVIKKRYPMHEGLLIAAGLGMRNEEVFEVYQLGRDLYRFGLAELVLGFEL